MPVTFMFCEIIFISTINRVSSLRRQIAPGAPAHSCHFTRYHAYTAKSHAYKHLSRCYPGKTCARLVCAALTSRSAVKTLVSGPTLITNGSANLHTDLTPLSFQRGRNIRGTAFESLRCV